MEPYRYSTGGFVYPRKRQHYLQNPGTPDTRWDDWNDRSTDAARDLGRDGRIGEPWNNGDRSQPRYGEASRNLMREDWGADNRPQDTSFSDLALKNSIATEFTATPLANRGSAPGAQPMPFRLADFVGDAQAPNDSVKPLAAKSGSAGPFVGRGNADVSARSVQWEHPITRQVRAARAAQREARSANLEAEIASAMPSDSTPEVRAFLRQQLQHVPSAERLAEGHYYPVITKVISAEYGASSGVASYFFRRFIVPGRGLAQAAEDGERYIVSDPRPWPYSLPSWIFEKLHDNPVRTSVSEDHLSGENTTLPWHFLYPGNVNRRLVRAPDGAWYSITEGHGDAWLAGADTINDWIGPGIFKKMDQDMSQTVRAYYGGPGED